MKAMQFTESLDTTEVSQNDDSSHENGETAASSLRRTVRFAPTASVYTVPAVVDPIDRARMWYSSHEESCMARQYQQHHQLVVWTVRVCALILMLGLALDWQQRQWRENLFPENSYNDCKGLSVTLEE